MTDKIIIDGVNVSKCIFLNTHVNSYCECYDIYEDNENDACIENSDCYYKELQRKTAECEELKEKLSQFNHTNAEFEQERNAFVNEVIKNKHYKQVLDEIEKLTKHWLNND